MTKLASSPKARSVTVLVTFRDKIICFEPQKNGDPRRVLAFQTVARCPLCGLDYATFEDENIGGSVRTVPETERMDASLWCCGPA